MSTLAAVRFRRAVAAALSAGLLAGAVSDPAGAQADQEVIAIPNVFEIDLAEIRETRRLTEAIEQASNRSECPSRIDVTIVMKSAGDELFEESLGKARYDSVDSFLRKMGFSPDQFSIEVKHVEAEPGSREEVRVRSDGRKAPPRLHTESLPDEGTKVQEGDAVEVTMTARDDVDPWQSGIESIQLTAEPGGLVDSKPFSRSIACTPGGQAPPPFKVQYKVPANPPPVVRLRAVATDFAGNTEFDLGEFPTGDWYGTMILHREIRPTGYFHEVAWTFAVSLSPSERDVRTADGELIIGEVRGRAVGQIAYADTSRFEECTSSHTIRPVFFETEVTGQAFFRTRDMGGKGELDRLIVDLGIDAAHTIRTHCIRGFGETRTQIFNDTAGALFDFPTIYGPRMVVPPSDEDNRVTTTMELHQARR